MRDRSLTTITLVLTIVSALIIMAYSKFAGAVFSLESNLGLYLPSPNMWQLSVPASFLLNVAGIFCGVPFIILLNKQFNFIGRSAGLAAAAYILLAATNPVITSALSTSTVLALSNMVALWTLCDTFRAKNATREFFFIATIISFGAMISYPFISMLPIYIIGGLMMKSFRWKEAVAMLLGLIAPYWTGIGLGLLHIDAFKIPSVTSFFADFSTPGSALAVILITGFAGVIALLLSLSNTVKLYAGNTRVRVTNTAINMMGYVSMLCMIADYNNMSAYLGTFYLWVAVQIACMAHLNRYIRPKVLLYILAGIFIPLYLWIEW